MTLRRGKGRGRKERGGGDAERGKVGIVAITPLKMMWREVERLGLVVGVLRCGQFQIRFQLRHFRLEPHVPVEVRVASGRGLVWVVFGIFVERKGGTRGGEEICGTGKWEKKEDRGRPSFRCLHAYVEREGEI
jgi:hypothetical protein